MHGFFSPMGLWLGKHEFSHIIVTFRSARHKILPSCSLPQSLMVHVSACRLNSSWSRVSHIPTKRRLSLLYTELSLEFYPSAASACTLHGNVLSSDAVGLIRGQLLKLPFGRGWWTVTCFGTGTGEMGHLGRTNWRIPSLSFLRKKKIELKRKTDIFRYKNPKYVFLLIR